MKQKILLLLFELGFALKFNIVGTISISEIALLLMAPWFLLKVNWRDKDVFMVLTLYLCLFVTQFTSELFIGNTAQNMMKGLAVTVVSFLHFFFLYVFLRRDKSLIFYLVLSMIVSQLIAGPSDIISQNEISMADMSEGVEIAMLKFYIAPLVINIALLFSLVSKWKNYCLLFVAVGILFVVAGARSSGLLMFITGLVAFWAEKIPSLFSGKKALYTFGSLAVFGYSIYCLYAYAVVSGMLSSGNSDQLLRCDNPYNPLELMIRGRAEVWVGWQAFMEQPVFGHGSWATDNTGHYIDLMQKAQNYVAAPLNEMSFLIPSHSVIVGIAMSNGLLPFLTVTALIMMFVRYGFSAIRHTPNKYKVILVFFLFDIIWTAMFSPISHFRLTIPVEAAVIFALYKRLRFKLVIDTEKDENLLCNNG